MSDNGEQSGSKQTKEEGIDDIELLIEDKKMKFKKRFLIDNSDYFKAMFAGSFRESTMTTIPLEDLEASAMDLIVKLILNPDYLPNVDETISILRASCMFQFVKVKSICISRLTELLEVDNCINVWMLAEQQSISTLSAKAKKLALIEFETLKNNDSLMQLTLKDISIYLGNINLQCHNELSVFQTAMRWYYHHFDEFGDESNHILLKLLACVDFKNLSIDDLKEMKGSGEISENTFISDILNCVMETKSNSDLVGYDEECVKLSKTLLNCQGRIFQQYPGLLMENLLPHKHKRLKVEQELEVINYDASTSDDKNLNTEAIPKACRGNYQIIYYDPNVNELKKLVKFNQGLRSDLKGCKLLGYKQFIFLFGGEFGIGSGNWNYNFLSFDTIKEIWNCRTVLPYARRHFEACICGDYLYIIGGTGSFRVKQENMLQYSCKENTWSTPIMLPCPAGQIKCCEFNNQLFLLYSYEQCGYFFLENGEWERKDIEDPNHYISPLLFRTFSMSSYKNGPLLKGDNCLIKLEMQQNDLVALMYNFRPVGNPQWLSVLCENTWYTLFTGCEDDGLETTSFEKLDIFLPKFDMSKDVFRYDKSFIFEKLPHDFVIKINGQEDLFSVIIELFPFHYNNLVTENKVLNDFIFE